MTSDAPYPGSCHVPEDPEATSWDAIVIGTGMGGATLGYSLARRGQKVLFLEKGGYLLDASLRGDGRPPVDEDNSPEGRLVRGWWPHELEGRTSFGRTRFFAPLGCGTGGTTGLYAAQLERMLPSDFEPGRHFDVPGATHPAKWPVGVEELTPFYREAEALYRVTGTDDPLHPDPDATLRTPPPLSPRDAALESSFQGLGLNPYRAHAGFEFKDGCEECGSVLCPRMCKGDAGSVALRPALENHDAKILCECEVVRLEADGQEVRRVEARWKGREISLRARTVVLAAGAYASPVLLLNSRNQDWPDGLANRSGMVGRNLMLHASDFVAIRPGEHLSSDGPRKALALNDFYVVEGSKLGTLQSVGIEINRGYVLFYLQNKAMKHGRVLRKLASPFLRVAAVIGARHFRSAAVFATILEDLPYRENRVFPSDRARSGFEFEYVYSDELKARNRLFRSALKDTIGSRHNLVFITGQDNLNYGHVCGTCRFGTDPETSVLDPANRAHGLKNLYVVDASFFPSSGGTNPSLTVAANALRVAGEISA